MTRLALNLFLPATESTVEPPVRPPKGKRSAVGLADGVKLATAGAVISEQERTLVPDVLRVR
jgi:hypothetical protein